MLSHHNTRTHKPKRNPSSKRTALSHTQRTHATCGASLRFGGSLRFWRSSAQFVMFLPMTSSAARSAFGARACCSSNSRQGSSTGARGGAVQHQARDHLGARHHMQATPLDRVTAAGRLAYSTPQLYSTSQLWTHTLRHKTQHARVHSELHTHSLVTDSVVARAPQVTSPPPSPAALAALGSAVGAPSPS